MFGWWRKRRRKRILEQPFPAAWEDLLRRKVPFYRLLEPDQAARLRELVQLFVAEKPFFGAAGLAVTDEMRVVIAAAAVRLVLHLDLSLFDDLREIVVYPYDALRRPDGRHGGAFLGEAHSFGTVVLSWPAVEAGLADPCDGHDTATHEFAHVLDRAGGGFSGTPPLRAREHYRAWAEVMARRFARLRGGGWPERHVLRAYGAKNEAEFFAVATEAFFERPAQLRQATPDLYEELRRFFGFDPRQDPSCGSTERPPPAP
jgi:hypothetical protein